MDDIVTSERFDIFKYEFKEKQVKGSFYYMPIMLMLIY